MVTSADLTMIQMYVECKYSTNIRSTRWGQNSIVVPTTTWWMTEWSIECYSIATLEQSHHFVALHTNRSQMPLQAAHAPAKNA